MLYNSYTFIFTYNDTSALVCLFRVRYHCRSIHGSCLATAAYVTRASCWRLGLSVTVRLGWVILLREWGRREIRPWRRWSNRESSFNHSEREPRDWREIGGMSVSNVDYSGVSLQNDGSDVTTNYTTCRYCIAVFFCPFIFHHGWALYFMNWPQKKKFMNLISWMT